MMAGLSASDNALAHARELLDAAAAGARRTLTRRPAADTVHGGGPADTMRRCQSATSPPS